jgi:hypothetical protein
MIIYYHVVVALVWRNTVVKQFIRTLHDVYALTFGLIVAPTHFSTEGGGREMICVGQCMPSLFTTMVDAMHRSPYTVYDSKLSFP